MTSSIDPTQPTSTHPRLSHVRANFAAAKAEIEALGAMILELSTANKRISKYNIIGLLAINTGTMRWYPEADITITAVYFSLGTAGTSLVEIDVKINGASIFATTKPAASSGLYKSSIQTVSIAVTPSDYLTVDVTHAGAAKDAVICIIYH